MKATICMRFEEMAEEQATDQQSRQVMSDRIEVGEASVN
jgi:hypothetical protein